MMGRQFDVIIVGGGIIGTSLAYFLSRNRVKVRVVEKEGIGQQASQGAVGFLTIDVVPFKPEPLLRAALNSRSSYPELAAEFQSAYGINIGLERCGTLRVSRTPKELSDLREEIAWHQAHVAEVEFVSESQIRRRWPAVQGPIAGGFFYPSDFQVTSSRVVEAFRAGAEKHGAIFEEYNEVTGWQRKGRRLAGIVTNKGPVSGDVFVLCAGPWSQKLGELLEIDIPVYPVRGQLLIFEMKERLISCPIIMGGASESFYLGPKPDGLYAGTTLEEAGFDVSCSPEALDRIAEQVAQIVPQVTQLPIKGSWAGLRPATKDKMPILGLAPGWDNLYLATGHFRKGILLAPWTGRTMTDLILGRKPEMPLDAFSPARFNQKTLQP